MANVKSYFSISFDLILVGEKLPYDLYVNSSTREKREKFVRIFPIDGILEKQDIVEFKKKYLQLYVAEEQRSAYLRSLSKVDVEDSEKVTVIKGSTIEYLEKVFDTEKEFTTEVLEEVVQDCRTSVESMIDVIQDYNVNQVQELIAELSFHDFYTYDHSINVSMYCISILKAMKPTAKREELITAGMGGLLHDLGKIKVPTAIINSPKKLTVEEFEIIKKHPEYGDELFGDGPCDCGMDDIDFTIIRRVIMEHHENYNGTGYPNKIEGEDIHVYARICAIADFFDAITTKRSYHEVLNIQDALEVMNKSIGRKIDPKIFSIFTKNVNVVLQGRTNQELEDNFDPCQPHEALPLVRPKAKKLGDGNFLKKENPEDFKKKKKKKKAA